MTMSLTSELSRTFRGTRQRSSCALWCALALLGVATACSGTIEGDDVDGARAATSDSPEDRSDGARESTTRDRAAAPDEDDADESALGEDEQDEDDVRGISGRPRSSGGSGVGRRSQPDRDEELSDAGVQDAGDGGVLVDAGVIVDAGVVDVDAGAVDAGAP
jgi:hypothetical protein